MEVNFNVNVAAVGSAPLPSSDPAIDGAGRAGRVDGAAESVRLTEAAPDAARASSVRFAFPDDLELPAAVDGAAAVGSLCEKLLSGDGLGLTAAERLEIAQDVTEQVASAAAEAGASAGGSTQVMFDLYKLMALLVEVAQAQRDSARELRSAASAQVQNAVLAQAQQQRSAALTGMIAGAICCAIQVGFSAGSIVKTAKAFNTQFSMMGESGVTSARQNLSALENAKTPEAAQRQLAKVEGKVGEDVAQEVKRGFGDMRDVDLNDPHWAETAGAKKAAFNSVRNGGPDGEAATPEEIEAARTDLRAAIKNDLRGFEDAAAEARGALANAGPGADLAALKQNVKAADAKLSYARAYAANELAQEGVTTQAEYVQDVQSAAARVASAQEALAQNPEYMKAGNSFQRGEAYNGLINTIGTCVQSVIQNATQLQQAKATEESAAQQQAQGNLDQMKDFFDAAGDLMTQVIQLMNAVGSAEAQSMRDAIQA